MSDADLVWEDIAPYVLRVRQSHELGARRAAEVALRLKKELDTEHVEVCLRGEHAPGPGYGSCSRFFIYFDDGWRPIDKRLAQGHGHEIELALSERGPFVTCRGGQWRMQRRDDRGQVMVRSPESGEASAKAKALALDIAHEFGLRYVDAEWLRQFKLTSLVELPLPWDVAQSLDLDDSEPNALNVLFCEEL